MILTIARRELGALFLSPLAWTVLAVVQLLLAYAFLAQVDGYQQLQGSLAGMVGAPGVTDLVVAPLFRSAANLALMVTPLLTMRLIAEERRNRTLVLLYSAPISTSQLVLGKYLGMLIFLAILVALIAAMPLSLLIVTPLDLGKLGAGVVGLYLLLAAFAAAGLWVSSLTAYPTEAAVSSFGLLLMLWILDWVGDVPERADPLFRYLSLLRHHEALIEGELVRSDLIYFLLFIATFLLLSIRTLEADRLRH